jgi:hypothetical protein
MTRMPKPKSAAIASLGVDIGKNTFHLIEVRECQGPWRQVSRTSVSGPSPFWGDKKPRPVGGNARCHFSPRGDIVLGISASPALLLGGAESSARSRSSPALGAAGQGSAGEAMALGTWPEPTVRCR